MLAKTPGGRQDNAYQDWQILRRAQRSEATRHLERRVRTPPAPLAHHLRKQVAQRAGQVRPVVRQRLGLLLRDCLEVFLGVAREPQWLRAREPFVERYRERIDV